MCPPSPYFRHFLPTKNLKGFLFPSSLFLLPHTPTTITLTSYFFPT